MEENMDSTNKYESSLLFSQIRDDNHFNINVSQLDENVENPLQTNKNIFEEFVGDEENYNDDHHETNLESKQCDDQRNIYT